MPIRKSYAIEKSPFFKLSNKRKLMDLLDENLKSIQALLKLQNYKVYNKIDRERSKSRTIYAPKDHIKRLHKKIQKLLSRIQTPDYLFSGKKGLSYVDNAQFHSEANYLITVDIRKFYPNCKKEYVFKSFRYIFKMSEDVAWLMADILVYENFIPTGSPASQLIAYWAYKDTFDRISKIAKEYNARFSLYVDDMTFSSEQLISKKLIFDVRKELEKVGHSIHPKKISTYTRTKYKTVTGCIITPDHEIRVRNIQRKEVLDNWRKLHTNPEKDQKMISSLKGQIQSARQLEPELFESKYRYLTALLNAIQ